MIRLINTFIDICLLRKGPQDLPASNVLTMLCLIAHFLIGVSAEIILGEAGQAVAWATLSSLLMIGSVYALLSLRGLTLRTRQTLSAFAGTSVLMTLIFLPITLSIIQANEAQQAVNELVSVAWLVVFFWSFVLDAHIFRHALSVSFTIGVLLATLLFSLSWSLHRTLFGVAS